MLITDTSLKDKLLNNCTHREIIIKFPDDDIADIGSGNIIAESFELTHSICDGNEFVLGGCIAGQLTVQVIGIEQALNNKRINVFLKCTYLSDVLYPSSTLYPSDTLFPGTVSNTYEIQLFSGTIDSSLRQKNRSVKEIIAYDDMYAMSNISCKNWFLGLVQYTITQQSTSLNDLKKDILDQLDIALDRNANRKLRVGFNDKSVLNTTYDVANNAVNDKVTLLDLFKDYCELNALFGVIDNEGAIKTVQLYQVLDDGSTAKKDISETIPSYKDLTFEEYTTRPINRIRFTYNKDKKFDYGYSLGKESWYISNNGLTACLSDIGSIVTAFSQNGKNYIFNDLYSYRPFSAEVFARWWIEPGDRVVIKTGYNDTETVDSFVFSRTIKGINGMSVTIKAGGVEYLGKDEITDGSELSTNKLG